MLCTSARTAAARQSGRISSRGVRTWPAGSPPSPRPNTSFRTTAGLVTAAGIATGGILLYTLPVVHSDAPNFVGNIKDAVRSVEEQIVGADTKQVDWLSVSVDAAHGSLVSLLWGSNKKNTVAPDAPSTDSLRYPTNAEWLKDVALRDLTLDEHHAACVDVRGDLYQWGDGFTESTTPIRTLTGQDITAITTTPTRVFALSSSGKVFVLPSSATAATSQTLSGSSWLGSLWGGTAHSGFDFAELAVEGGLSRGERVVQLAAGAHHLLALTSQGRTLAHPLDSLANTHGQLAVRTVSRPAADGQGASRAAIELVPAPARMRGMRTAPPTWETLGEQANISLAPRPSVPVAEAPRPPKPTEADLRDIRWCDRLFEVPALRGIEVAQLAAGARSSFARTADGRVLAWGGNEYGQLGLGGNMTIDTVTRPTEVVFSKSGSRPTCTDIACGSDLTLFTVERSTGLNTSVVDVLACGNGQFGGLGGAIYSNAQGTPSRVRNVSGLTEYSDAHGGMQPIRPHAVSVSTTGHVLLTLDTLRAAAPSPATSAAAGTAPVGRDLLLWGANNGGELGNGRRSSTAVPAGLKGLAGGRFMLTTRTAPVVKDMQGNVWKRGVSVEQCAVAGAGSSAVYWRVR